MATIGIDLGTTNSLVAYWTDHGAALIPNALGEYLTPSVISVDESGEVLVGRIAKERLITHPHVTASTFKRFIGTEKKYELGMYTFSSEELSSFIIQSLKQDAEAYLNEAVTGAVILIGGATRMPLIKSVISKMFGRMPHANINPDETVALGAAIQVALKERNKALEEVILTDVCPYTLGTSVVQALGNGQQESRYFFPIIERNTTIPVSQVERLYTVNDRQHSILVDVYQGENRLVKNNLKLGELKIKVPPAPAGQEAIDIRYTYDINGILEVEVISTTTGEKKRAMIHQEY